MLERKVDRLEMFHSLFHVDEGHNIAGIAHKVVGQEQMSRLPTFLSAEESVYLKRLNKSAFFPLLRDRTSYRISGLTPNPIRSKHLSDYSIFVLGPENHSLTVSSRFLRWLGTANEISQFASTVGFPQ